MYTYERKVNGSLLARCIFSASRDAPRTVWGCCRQNLCYRKLFFTKTKSKLSILDGWRVYHCYLGSPRDGLVPYSGPTYSCLLSGQLFLHGFSVFPEYVAQSCCWLVGWLVLWWSLFFFILSWGYTLVFLYNTRYPTKILFSSHFTFLLW